MPCKSLWVHQQWFQLHSPLCTLAHSAQWCLKPGSHLLTIQRCSHKCLRKSIQHIFKNCFKIFPLNCINSTDLLLLCILLIFIKIFLSIFCSLYFWIGSVDNGLELNYLISISIVLYKKSPSEIHSITLSSKIQKLITVFSGCSLYWTILQTYGTSVKCIA
jgi:hypothetical protein